MPHEWNNIIVVTANELAPWYTEGALRLAIWRYRDKPYGPKRVRRAGHGREMLVAFDSLSEEIRNVLGDPRKVSHLLERYYRIDDETVTFYSNYTVNSESLSLPHQEEYIINASVIKACAALKEARETERRNKGGSLKGVMSTVHRDAMTFNEVLRTKHNAQHTLPTSEKRFKLTFKAFLKEGYVSLVSVRLANQNAKVITDEVVELLNSVFAGQGKKPTPTEVARVYESFLSGYTEVICVETGEMYDPKEFKPISERTILRYLGKWEERIGTYSKRSGDRQKLIQKFKPSHSMNRPTYSGSIISIDDRQPPFAYATGQRAWFYNGIDLASEAFTVFVYGKSKEGIIEEFYRALVRNYTEWGLNLPAELEAEMSLNSRYVNTFLRPGVMFQYVRIEANNARGKRIEAYYRQLRYKVEKDREGWLARPHALSEANQAGPKQNVILPYNQIIENALKDIEDWNNMPHSIHQDKTRWEVFIERQHPQLKPTNWRAILQHIGYATETSCNAGIVKLQSGEFLLGDESEVYAGERLILLMKKVEGKTFTARWLDNSKGDVLKAAVFINDTYICELIAKPRYNRATIERTPEDERNREIMSSYVATIEGYMRRKAGEIPDILIIDNQQKTLNRKFVIPGLTKYEATENETPEIIDPVKDDDSDYTTPPPSFVKPLKDRF